MRSAAQQALAENPARSGDTSGSGSIMLTRRHLPRVCDVFGVPAGTANRLGFAGSGFKL